MTESTTTDAAVAAVTTKLTYTASAATVIAGLTLPEWAAAFGIGATLATLALTVWLKLRIDRREEELHRARMEAFKAGLDE